MAGRLMPLVCRRRFGSRCQGDTLKTDAWFGISKPAEKFTQPYWDMKHVFVD